MKNKIAFFSVCCFLAIAFSRSFAAYSSQARFSTSNIETARFIANTSGTAESAKMKVENGVQAVTIGGFQLTNQEEGNISDVSQIYSVDFNLSKKLPESFNLYLCDKEDGAIIQPSGVSDDGTTYHFDSLTEFASGVASVKEYDVVVSQESSVVDTSNIMAFNDFTFSANVKVTQKD